MTAKRSIDLLWQMESSIRLKDSKAKAQSLYRQLEAVLFGNHKSLLPRKHSLRRQLDTLKQPFITRDHASLILLKEVRSTIYDLSAETLVPVQTPNWQLGKKIYTDHCVSCHGSKAMGDGELLKSSGRKARPLATNDYRDHISLIQMFTAIAIGRKKTPMPSFSSSLTDHQIWSVTIYLFSLIQGRPEANQGQSIQKPILDPKIADKLTRREFISSSIKDLSSSLRLKNPLLRQELTGLMISEELHQRVPR